VRTPIPRDTRIAAAFGHRPVAACNALFDGADRASGLASNGLFSSSSDKECIMGTISSTAGNVAASGGSAASGGVSTDAITGQIAANAQQGLEIAQAQAQASVKQAAGEALKSGASGLKDAAKAS
jgi:hypothetical protein